MAGVPRAAAACGWRCSRHRSPCCRPSPGVRRFPRRLLPPPRPPTSPRPRIALPLRLRMRRERPPIHIPISRSWSCSKARLTPRPSRTCRIRRAPTRRRLSHIPRTSRFTPSPSPPPRRRRLKTPPLTTHIRNSRSRTCSGVQRIPRRRPSRTCRIRRAPTRHRLSNKLQTAGTIPPDNPSAGKFSRVANGLAVADR